MIEKHIFSVCLLKTFNIFIDAGHKLKSTVKARSKHLLKIFTLYTYKITLTKLLRNLE